MEFVILTKLLLIFLLLPLNLVKLNGTVMCVVLLIASTDAIFQRHPFDGCDYPVFLSANEGRGIASWGTYISPWGFLGFFGFFDPGSSCRYRIQGPTNYAIQMTCDINLIITVNRLNFCFSNTP